VIRIGRSTPVDAFPPNIIARTGTTIIETPGTPVLDIPIKIAHNPINAKWVYDKDRGVKQPDIINNFLV
jgi:hypothetical protein